MRLLVGGVRACSTVPEDSKYVADKVNSAKVVLFMKGEPHDPRCGFSNAVCRILEMHGVLETQQVKTDKPLFNSFDVLSDERLRSAAKVFADWPTFPQLYMDGEFAGGCDVLLENHKNGEF
ncbi:RAC-gamma serine/threonine-protein kinase, partial [Cichlidogyrus casuarinus]